MRSYRKIRYPEEHQQMRKKNPAAVALGKRSGINMTAEERKQRAAKAGSVGGTKTAASLTPEERQANARKAARARWGKKGASQKTKR
jgi:hypothetical protein